MVSRINARPDWPLAVIVGAGGMGMAVARRIGQTHRLLLADRDFAHLERCLDTLEQEGHDARIMPCDVTKADDVAALGDRALEAGPVQSLAHVVGLSVAAADFEAILSVNLVGAALMADRFRAILRPGGCGLFISSSAAHMRPAPDDLLPLLDAPLQDGLVDSLKAARADAADAGDAYFLSKVALNRFCRREAPAWGRLGLRIISLSPGLIATPMGAEAYKHSPVKQRMFDAIPIAREGTMLEIANVAAFLLSDQASYISGTDILVDGGLIAGFVYQ